MEPERAGQVLLARGVHFGDQRGQGDAAPIGDLLQHIPELLLQRDAGGMSGDDQRMLPQDWRVEAGPHTLEVVALLLRAR